MKLYFSLMLFLGSTLSVLAGESHLSDLDRRVIAVFEEHGHDWEPVRYPKDHPYWKELQWYRNQGDKVRRGLMHLLTKTYDGDFPKMTHVIAGLETSPGDPSDVVDYVRTHLPDMLESEQAYGKSGYIQSCLHVLAKFGGPEDKKLMNLFLDYHDVTVRSTAMTQAKNLQKRIDSDSLRETSSRADKRPAAEGESELKALRPEAESLHKRQLGVSSLSKWLQWPQSWVFFGYIGFIAVVIAAWWKLWRGRYQKIEK